MSGCFAWSVVVTSAPKNFNYHGCYEHIPLGKYHFLIFELIWVSAVYFLLRVACLMVWNQNYPNFLNLRADATGGTPLCASHFSPQNDVEVQAGCGHPALPEKAWSNLRRGQLQFCLKGGTSYCIIIISPRQSPMASGCMLHVGNFGTDVLLKIHEMRSLFFFAQIPTENWKFISNFSLAHLNIFQKLLWFGVNRNYVPSGTLSCISGKLM